LIRPCDRRDGAAISVRKADLAKGRQARFTPHAMPSEDAPKDWRSAQALALPETTRHRITSFRLLNTSGIWARFAFLARGS
jgi:hypothetical protein